MSPQRKLDELQLLEKHVNRDYNRFGGRSDAWLKDSGVSIWVLVELLDVCEGDVGRVAQNHGLSSEEMDAVLAYYRRNKHYVDARILLNEA